MPVLRIVIGSLDKASAAEVYDLSKDAAETISKEVDKYGRACLKGGTLCMREGGDRADRDPHHGDPVYIVRIAADTRVIRKVLRAVDPFLAEEWVKNRGNAVSGTGRVWWVVG